MKLIFDDAEYASYMNQRYAEMSPELLARCCVVFDKDLGPAAKREFLRMYHKEGLHWFDKCFGHFAVGMGIRNSLRKAGIKDDVLPQGNWDDYYVAAIEFWLGVRE